MLAAYYTKISSSSWLRLHSAWKRANEAAEIMIRQKPLRVHVVQFWSFPSSITLARLKKSLFKLFCHSIGKCARVFYQLNLWRPKEMFRQAFVGLPLMINEQLRAIILSHLYGKVYSPLGTQWHISMGRLGSWIRVNNSRFYYRSDIKLFLNSHRCIWAQGVGSPMWKKHVVSWYISRYS